MTEPSNGSDRWPRGYRAALCLSFDVDGVYGEVNYQPAENTYAVSQTAYDVTGTERILEILADAGAHSTFCWVGRAAEETPELVRRAQESGHEISLHSWDHRYYNRMTRDEQRADMLRTQDAIVAITGVPATGHKTPGWRFNAETFELAQELGLLWVMDEPVGDLPRLIWPSAELPPIVQLPPSRHYDDYSFFVDHMMTPKQTFEFWCEDLDVLRGEGKAMFLTMHPFVSGRPGPSRAFSQLIDYAIDLGDVWIARADQIARWWVDRANEVAG